MNLIASEIRFPLLVERAKRRVKNETSDKFFFESVGPKEKKGYMYIQDYFSSITRDDQPFLESLLEANDEEFQILVESIPGMNWLRRLGSSAWKKLYNKAKGMSFKNMIAKLEKMYKVGQTPINKETMKKAYDASADTMVRKYNEILKEFDGNHKVAKSVLASAFVVFMVPGGVVLAQLWVKMLKALYRKLKQKNFEGGEITKADIPFEVVARA